MTWLTPPKIARQLGISVDKLLHWINTKELPATNVATHRSSRPRWRVNQSDLEAFLAARSNRLNAITTRRRQRTPSRVKEFV